MKKFILLNILVVLILILAACTEPEPPGIGIMDMNRVLQKSKRARQLNEQLSSIGDELEQTYKQKEKELTGENKKQKLDEIYQQFLTNKNSLEGQLKQEVQQVLADITEENNIDVVLNNKNVHFGGEDITETLIQKLDEEFYKEKNNEK